MPYLLTESAARRRALLLLAATCGLSLRPAAAAAAAAAPAASTTPARDGATVGSPDDQGWNALAFAATTQADVLRALGLTGVLHSDDSRITLRAPELAENGAVVPVSVVSAAPGVQRVVLLVPRNPNLLAADFVLSPQVLANISTRLKLAETGPVVALVQTTDGVLVTQREVKITIGGCGG